MFAYRTIVTIILALLVPLSCAAAEKPPRLMCELRGFEAAEAHQGVAVDEQYVYAVTNRAVGKYSKQSGQLIDRWQAPRESPLQHLNSGVVVGGKLYAAHSNWPRQPLENSIEMWDAQTLAHVGRHEFPDTAGALTWVDRRDGHWWAVLAFYGDRDTVRRTELLQLDDRWQRRAAWRFPPEVVDRFLPYSCSGGSWGPNGLLYVTGHDRGELYALRVPAPGGALELVDVVPAGIAGQGIAWDRSDVGVLYGIRRRSREVVVSRLSHAEENGPLRQAVSWQRDPRNPILPPSESADFDATRCMNPWVLAQGGQYHLYYSGGDRRGRQRICLATADQRDVSAWQRHGPLFDTGRAGAFDAQWCVLPHVVQVEPDRWHLYYTGNAGRGAGLSAFPGLGLAVSADGKSWKRSADKPILEPSRQAGDPDAIGIAGGSVLPVKQADGSRQWRFYYTGCPTVGDELPLHQQKTICLAVSADGVQWQKQGAVMFRDARRDYENIGVAGPVVRQNPDGLYRMWYSAIGTRWGYYSICYAESADGVHWRRGQPGDNLQLAPQGDGWEGQMVEYPAIVPEGDRLRMFYCGNGYGRTGIGTALGAPQAP